MGPLVMVHLLPYSSLRNTFKQVKKIRMFSSGTQPIRGPHKRFTVVSPTSCSPTSEVDSLACWVSSLTAFSWSVAERTKYVLAYRTFFIMAERTKHIHAQRSVRFLAERHDTFANGTLAKRLVTRWRNNRSPSKLRLKPHANAKYLLTLLQVQSLSRRTSSI